MSTPTRTTATSRPRWTRSRPRRKDEALIELYRRLRPGDPPTRDNATQMLENLFFNDRRYDLARVGRYKLNKRLHADDTAPIARSRSAS